MKKILVALLMVVSAVGAWAGESISRDVKVLPTAAQSALRNNFKAKVSFIKIDKTLGMIDDYEVVLDNGCEVTFDRDGNWKEVEMRANMQVPSWFVPANIASYVKQKQNNAKIIGIERERSGYKVELANGIEMKFDKNGNFVKYDD